MRVIHKDGFLRSALGNSQLLLWYGDTPVIGEGKSFQQLWNEATELNSSQMFAALRQGMLALHLDLVPEDENWR